MSTHQTYKALSATILFVLGSLNVASHQSEWGLRPTNLHFAPKSARIADSDKVQLNLLKSEMDANPGFRLVVEGSPAKSRFEKQLNWERVNNIITYMTSINNQDRQRFIFKYNGNAPPNRVIYRLPYDYESGSDKIPPPPYPSFHRAIK